MCGPGPDPNSDDLSHKPTVFEVSEVKKVILERFMDPNAGIPLPIDYIRDFLDVRTDIIIAACNQIVEENHNAEMSKPDDVLFADEDAAVDDLSELMGRLLHEAARPQVEANLIVNAPPTPRVFVEYDALPEQVKRAKAETMDRFRDLLWENGIILLVESKPANFYWPRPGLLERIKVKFKRWRFRREIRRHPDRLHTVLNPEPNPVLERVRCKMNALIDNVGFNDNLLEVVREEFPEARVECERDIRECDVFFFSVDEFGETRISFLRMS